MSIDIALRIVLASSNMDDSCRVVKIFAIHGWFATRCCITGSDFPVSYSHSDRKLMTNRPAGVTSYSIGLNPSYRNCDSWRYIVQLHRRERIIRSTCAVPLQWQLLFVSIAETEIKAQNSFPRVHLSRIHRDVRVS